MELLSWPSRWGSVGVSESDIPRRSHERNCFELASLKPQNATITDDRRRGPSEVPSLPVARQSRISATERVAQRRDSTCDHKRTCRTKCGTNSPANSLSLDHMTLQVNQAAGGTCNVFPKKTRFCKASECTESGSLLSSRQPSGGVAPSQKYQLDLSIA
jgi:hypothetical protein